jgi:hypothetical protein
MLFCTIWLSIPAFSPYWTQATKNSSINCVIPTFAGVAELVDALGLGPSGSNPVEVQVLSPAQETTLI